MSTFDKRIIHEQGYIDIGEAANVLGVTRRTMYDWRSRNYGPRPGLFAGRLWYSEAEVRRFLADSLAGARR